MILKKLMKMYLKLFSSILGIYLCNFRISFTRNYKNVILYYLDKSLIKRFISAFNIIFFIILILVILL